VVREIIVDDNDFVELWRMSNGKIRLMVGDNNKGSDNGYCVIMGREELKELLKIMQEVLQ
jgi:hypothetical protein